MVAFFGAHVSMNAQQSSGTILVTGGAGYIGSHTLVALCDAGYQPVVIDNFCNSSPEPLRRVEKLAGTAIPWIEADVRDAAKLHQVFERVRPQAVMHFAGLKAVGESVQQPLLYHAVNVGGTANLLEAMRANSCNQLIFSSSATVYGAPQWLPYTEDHPISPMNPYGFTKACAEQLITQTQVCWPELKAVSLRYFNPVGAHPSGHLGEDPCGIPNNLMPYIAQVAVGRLPHLQVFGTDYDTDDGTGVRDYIHVMDLAQGHLRALEQLPRLSDVPAINLGSGQGVSVHQLREAFERASGKPVAWRAVGRRPGDLPSYYADASLAEKRLGWQTQLGAQDMCRDTWRWQSSNPSGYQSEPREIGA